MNLTTRLNKIEAMLSNEPEESCDACGFPTTSINVILTEETDTPTHCQRCGRVLNVDGCPIADGGTQIVLEGVADG